MPTSEERIIVLLESLLVRLDERAERHWQALTKQLDDNSIILAQLVEDGHRSLAQIISDNHRFMTQALERIVNTTDRTERMTAEILARLAKEQDLY